MRTIHARLRIITPMFIGDGDQKATAIRPPSIKGALRFWWRALNWGRCRADADHDEAEGLKRLHEEECRLFGRSALEENNEQVGGQGAFLLRVRQPDGLGRLVTDWPVNNTGSGYLGFGLMKTTDDPHREGLREGLEFDLELAFRKTDPDQIASVREALTAWALLGGLGSRSRRGFGSLTLVSMDGQDQLLDRQGYRGAVEQLLQDGATLRAWPPFTAFSAHSNFRELATGRDARRVHGEAGQIYKQHRGQSSSLRGVAKVPFGLPLQGVGNQNDRRASPLLFHVQQLIDGQYLASVLYLPAVFHVAYPKGHSDPGSFYRVVEDFVIRKDGGQP